MHVAECTQFLVWVSPGKDGSRGLPLDYRRTPGIDRRERRCRQLFPEAESGRNGGFNVEADEYNTER